MELTPWAAIRVHPMGFKSWWDPSSICILYSLLCTPTKLSYKKVCYCIKQVRIFFSNVSSFSTFFSTSPKITDVLEPVCSKSLPSTCQTRWNFQPAVVESVKTLRTQLIEVFDIILNDETWDDRSTCEAYGLKNLLLDENLLIYLDFFHDIMKNVHVLYNIIQKKRNRRNQSRSWICQLYSSRRHWWEIPISPQKNGNVLKIQLLQPKFCRMFDTYW